MFRPTSFLLGALRRPMTTKKGNKNFYKGTGSGAMGHWTTDGKYKIENHRVRKFVVPSLEGFQLTPYVSPRADKTVYKIHTAQDYFTEDALSGLDEEGRAKLLQSADRYFSARRR